MNEFNITWCTRSSSDIYLFFFYSTFWSAHCIMSAKAFGTMNFLWGRITIDPCRPPSWVAKSNPWRTYIYPLMVAKIIIHKRKTKSFRSSVKAQNSTAASFEFVRAFEVFRAKKYWQYHSDLWYMIKQVIYIRFQSSADIFTENSYRADVRLLCACHLDRIADVYNQIIYNIWTSFYRVRTTIRYYGRTCSEVSLPRTAVILFKLVSYIFIHETLIQIKCVF